MYQKAREGMIKEFTGISAPYEEPENPEIIVETDEMDVEQSGIVILDDMSQNGTILMKKEKYGV